MVGRFLVGLVSCLVFVQVNPPLCSGQSLKDCRTIFIQPMPESLDAFVSAEIVKWGVLKVLSVEEKADCVASFARQASKTEIKSTGSSVVPTETSVRAETASQKLPRGGNYSEAAMNIIHRESSVVVWGDSASNKWSVGSGPQRLARKLVEQLKKDYLKQK